KDPLHEIRVRLRVLSDDEEARMDTLVLQNIQDLRRPIRVGTVVEGERKLLRLVAGALNDERGWDNLIDFVDYLAGLVVDLESARAFGGLLANAQHLAEAFKVDVLAGADHTEPAWRRRVVVLPHDRPHRWVFGPEPPNRVAGDAVGIPGLDFVIGGDPVQEPERLAGGRGFLLRKKEGGGGGERNGCRPHDP